MVASDPQGETFWFFERGMMTRIKSKKATVLFTPEKSPQASEQPGEVDKTQRISNFF